jgi:hypothetical protein
MKKLILILLLIPLVSYGQDLNDESNGYTEVVDVKLSKKEIHQKINEWIAINYKSAKDVIHLNTEDKVIIRGNFLVNLKVDKYVVNYRIHNSLTFSIRENKYKIDLVPNRLSNDGVINDIDISLLERFFHSKPLTEDEFIKTAQEAARIAFRSMGYSEQKTEKWLEKVPISYPNYLSNKSAWDSQFTSTFQSIKDYVNNSNSDDDW